MKDQIKDFENQVELLAEDNTRLESNTEILKRQLKEKESEISTFHYSYMTAEICVISF